MTVGQLGSQDGGKSGGGGTGASRAGTLLIQFATRLFRSRGGDEIVIDRHLTALGLVKVILSSLLNTLADGMLGKCGVELHFGSDGADETRGGAAAGKEIGDCRVVCIADRASLEFEGLGFGRGGEGDNAGVVGLELDGGMFGETLELLELEVG